MVDMEIKDLTSKMNEFVTAKGWYDPDSPKPQTVRSLAISLTIEAAEVLEHLQWAEHPADQEEFAQELADVALYLLQLAHVSGIDLEAAILNKLAINHQRQWNKPEQKIDE